MKRRVALIHAVPAAIGPLVQYYSSAAPELDLYNLLDDGLTRLFALDDHFPARRRLADMIAEARDTYRVDLVLLTCSAVPRPTLDALRAATVRETLSTAPPGTPPRPSPPALESGL